MRWGRAGRKHTGDPVAGFWAWWADRGRDLAERAIAAGDYADFVAAIGPQVDALGELDWELGPGLTAEHTLVVTGGGVPAARRQAQRWWASAPAATATWEFHPARQAAVETPAEVRFSGVVVDVGRFGFELEVDDAEQVVHVVVHHPMFAELDDETSGNAGFFALDRALGEDGVSRWIGGIEFARQPPVTAVSLSGLVEAVAALEADTRGARRPKWVDHPLHDLHVTVRAPNAAGADLGALGGRVVAVAADDGGDLLHLYADSADPAVLQDLRGLVPGAEVEAVPDPGWHRVFP